MRTLQAASWWLIFGQPPPSKTLKSTKQPLKTITSDSAKSKTSQKEPPPLSKAERTPNSAGGEIIGISDARQRLLKVINSPTYRVDGLDKAEEASSLNSAIYIVNNL